MEPCKCSARVTNSRTRWPDMGKHRASSIEPFMQQIQVGTQSLLVHTNRDDGASTTRVRANQSFECDQMCAARQGQVSSYEESYPCFVAGCSTGSGIFNEESYPCVYAATNTSGSAIPSCSHINLIQQDMRQALRQSFRVT